MGFLDSALGGSRRGGMSPLTMALLGTLAYRTMKGKGRLADMLGTSRPNPSAGSNTLGSSTAARPNTDMLGGLLGPGALSEGLNNLLNRFRQNGQADKAESWVSQGANTPISPHELETGLGEERIAWLMEQTKMSREELLAGLSQKLPEAIDELTPEGHVPTEQEMKRLM